jgi:hypothetical protein
MREDVLVKVAGDILKERSRRVFNYATIIFFNQEKTDISR